MKRIRISLSKPVLLQHFFWVARSKACKPCRNRQLDYCSLRCYKYENPCLTPVLYLRRITEYLEILMQSLSAITDTVECIMRHELAWLRLRA